MALLRFTKGSDQGRVHELHAQRTFVGRNPGACQIVIDETPVSREHAAIEFVDGDYYIEDLYSHNGTVVNGKSLTPGPAGRQPLFDADWIEVGGVLLTFEGDPSSETAVVMMADKIDPESHIRKAVNVSSNGHEMSARINAKGKPRTMLEIMDQLGQATSLKEVLPKALESLLQSFAAAESGFILLRDTPDEKFTPVASMRRDGRRERIRISQTIVNYVADNRTAVLSDNAIEDERFQNSSSVRGLNLHSMMCVPLINRDGHALGIIQLDVLDSRRQFTADDLDVLAAVARHIALAIENFTLHDAALREQKQRYEQQFRTLIEGSIQGVLIHRHGKPVFVNQAWAGFHGYTVDEVMGMESVVPLVAPEDRDRLLQYAALLMRGEPAPTRFEYRGVKRAGSLIGLENLSTRIEWQGSSAIQSTIYDVSEQKRAEQELQETHRELEQRVADRTAELARSNQELEQFTYLISHDLQEPLRTVAGYCRLLQRRSADKFDEGTNDHIRLILEGTQRMKVLIDELLRYSRVTTRERVLAQVELEQVLHDAEENLRAAIEESNAELTHDPLPAVTADQSLLLLLFQNLIGNSIKFRSARPPSIHIAVDERDKEYEFSVCDNGIGIDPQHAERIFVVFQRLHPRDQYSGVGMGLAICKKVVQRHQGRIWVESRPGEGAVFRFTLPKPRLA